MADTPARRHMRRVLAAQQAARSGQGQMRPDTPIYQQMLLQLASDRGRLKQIQSRQAKATLKAELVLGYEDYLQGVVAEGQGAADEVLTTLMLWNMDAGRYAHAMPLAEYVLRHRLDMPDAFARTTACVVAEEIADAALTAQKVGEAFDIDVLHQADALTDGHDMPDQVRAKLLLARARAVLLPATAELPPAQPLLEQAVADLRRAIALHDGCGGKEDLKRAERALKKYEAC